jgi:hypothetical protein
LEAFFERNPSSLQIRYLQTWARRRNLEAALFQSRHDPFVEAGMRRDYFAEAREPLIRRRPAQGSDRRVEVMRRAAFAGEVSLCHACVPAAVSAVSSPEFHRRACVPALYRRKRPAL